MPQRQRVTAVMACHDRRDRTLACLASLTRQTGHDAAVSAVVVDDGSTDGTAEAVERHHPWATVVRGRGDLWWNGGMRVAIAEAVSGHDPDHLWWLNDDTELDDDALSTLLATHRAWPTPGPGPIVVGSTRDPVTGALTYGGVVRPDRWRPMLFELVPPAADPRPAETMNGNCVLVPGPVARVVGELDPSYRHAMGDYDYGLRAREHGIDVVVAPGTIGTCARNPDPWASGDVEETWRKLTGPKGLPPDEWRTFTRRWAGPLWPVYYVSPYARRLARAARRRVPG